jgi:outer membrane protein assembly factor BamA
MVFLLILHKNVLLRYLYFRTLFLIIIVGQTTWGQSQNVYLKIQGENMKESHLIDSLSYKQRFNDFMSLQKELTDTHKKLQYIGYIESEVSKPTKINDSTFLSKIHLRKKFYTIYINHEKELVSSDLLQSISTQYDDTYFVIPLSKLESVLNQLNSNLANKGAPFTTVTLENIQKKDSVNLQANLIIGSKDRRNINNVVIKGYSKFPRSFVKYFLKIEAAQSFSLNQLKKKTKKLDNLLFANQIKPPEVLFTKDSTTVYLYLEKTKSNTFDGFLGFGNNEISKKIVFDGYLNLNLTNNLNFGEQFKLLYKSDENSQKTFDLKLSMPYLLGTPIGTEFDLNIFKKDSSFTTASQNLKIFYQINSKHKIAAGVRSIASNNLLANSGELMLNDYNTFYYDLTYHYKKFNSYDFLFPNNFEILTSAGIGQRKTTNQNINQVELKFNVSKIFNLDNKNSLYVNSNYQALLSNNYFTNELFRFGGINSIRGFEENSIEANALGYVNLEYRYRLNRNIYVNTITDAAYYENKVIEIKDKLFGFGIGFGIVTKAGLLRFIYANGKKENQNFNLNNSKIHLSLSTIF